MPSSDGWFRPEHGLTGTRVYKTWRSMKERCLNPKNPSYKCYGGRGIKICERWLSFENFLADMGDKPLGLTLERKDNNGDYTPENCYWATAKEQARNRGTNRYLTYNGITKTLTEWAEEKGMSPAALARRLNAEWSLEEALTLP